MVDWRQELIGETKDLAQRVRNVKVTDGDIHENLSRICKAVYPVAGPWTKESCEGLRDHLADLLGGSNGFVVTYDVLGNERHKAVCELRKLPDSYDYFSGTTIEWFRSLGEALGFERGKQTFAEVRDRLIHLLGGDQPTLSDMLGIWEENNG